LPDRSCDFLNIELRAETKRLAGRARRMSIGALAAFTVLVVAAAITGLYRLLPDNWAFALVFAGIIALVLPLNAAVSYFLIARPLAPAREMISLFDASSRWSWALVDGNPEVPTDAETMLRRIGKRDDATAKLIRAAALAKKGDLLAARGILDGWHPSDAAEVARKSRIAEQLAFELTGRDGIAEVKDAVAAIPDDLTRKQQLAFVVVQEACRKVAGGEPVMDSLRDARLQIGRLESPYLRLRERPWFPIAWCAFWVVTGSLAALAVAIILA
jgi:hypothetical protein